MFSALASLRFDVDMDLRNRWEVKTVPCRAVRFGVRTRGYLMVSW